MKEKIFTPLEQRGNRLFVDLVEARAFRLLGIFWKERIEWYWDKVTDNFVVRYK